MDRHCTSKMLLKSQCTDFVFKRDCLLCGKERKSKYIKNPHRRVQVKQCTTVDRVVISRSNNNQKTSVIKDRTSGLTR